MVVGPDAVYLCAETAVGRLWATQTFRHMLRLHGAILPQVRVNDAPAMRYRGVLLDVARRKVPHLSTLKSLVDTLSLLKINMLQLQVEHTFRFRRHPIIGRGCGPLTCDDLLELDAYCRLRGVELVPMLQSFGHMRNILMHDEYRHLAEHPQLQWSLCPTDPASLQFMDELYEEFLPCFSSTLVNIGCDETFDLGRPGSRSQALVAERGLTHVYLDYVLELYGLLTDKYGRRVMCWGDVLLHNPALLAEAPRDLLVLNWWYAPKERYDQVDPFVAAGLEQIVCPGTGSWNAIFPRLNTAWDNVEGFTRDGKAVGALGMLNTDWGDGGHFNLLGNSFYSYAHGAEAGWAAQPLARPAFEAVLGPALFGPGGEGIVSTITSLGNACDPPAGQHPAESLDTAAMLFASPIEVETLGKIPAAVLEELIFTSREAGASLDADAPASLEPSAVLDIAWSADALAYAARKTLFFQQVMALSATGGSPARLLATCDDLLMEHEATVTAFQERWNAGNRQSEIEVALGRFTHAEEVLRLVQQWLTDHNEALTHGEPVALPAVPAFQPPWCEDVRQLIEPEALTAWSETA
jgi:hypothetical protein